MAAIRPIAPARPPPSVSPLPPEDKDSSAVQKNGVSVSQPTTTDRPAVLPPVLGRPVPTLETRYNEFVKIVGEIGKDVKPAYTNSKVSTDRLRKNIMIARGVLRECLGDLDKLYGNTAYSEQK